MATKLPFQIMQSAIYYYKLLGLLQLSYSEVEVKCVH
jgi:hypothetical protein